MPLDGIHYIHIGLQKGIAPTFRYLQEEKELAFKNSHFTLKLAIFSKNFEKMAFFMVIFQQKYDDFDNFA